MQNILLAIGLTVFAGLATGIGSAIAFLARRTNYRFLSVSTGFSAGVMLYVSFVEIFYKGVDRLVEAFGDPLGHWVNVGSFFAGIALIAVIDNLIPSGDNPHETPAEGVTERLRSPIAPQENKKLVRMGLFTAWAISIHNFPEGLATFLAVLEDPKIGIAIAIAIALHNIPEGISVSVPIYYATGNRRKAFTLSLLSGLAEPAGAFIAFMLLRLFLGDSQGLPPYVMGALFGGVAGIMVYISLDELLPTSRAYGKGHDSLLGLVAGMGVIAASLLLMR